MNIEFRVTALEFAMLMPSGLAYVQYKADSLERWNVARFVAGNGNCEDDVDARLGSESWHGGRADVRIQQRTFTQGGADARGFALVERAQAGS